MIEFERCPFCSFSPTNMNDYCEKHRPTSPAPDLSALWGLVDDISEASGGLYRDAAAWRELANKTGGYTQVGLLRDALEHEAQASAREKWAERLEAALLASGIPRPTPEGR